MGLLRECRGVITIYLTIILLALFCLAGIIIDVTRIMVAENKVEGALAAAVRSNLAGYDKQLVGEYGLYASNVGEEETRRYFAANLQEGEGVKLITYDICEFNLETTDLRESLLNNERFREQILQYVKYKAPANLSLRFADVLGVETFEKNAQSFTAGYECYNEKTELKEELIKINERLNDLAPFYATPSVMAAGEEKTIEAIREMKEIKRLLETDIARHLESYKGKSANETYEEVEKLQVEIEQNKADLDNNIEILERMISGSGFSDGEGESGAEKAYLVRPVGFAIEEDMENEIEAGFLQSIENIKKKIAGLIKIIPVEDTIGEEILQEANRAVDADIVQVWSESFTQREQTYYENTDPDLIGELSGNIISFVTSLGGFLKDIALQGRDCLYIDEYILDKSTYATSPTARDHYFKNGEVEYVLCGFAYEGANLVGVFERIWFIRFAINTVEAFFKSVSPEIYSRLTQALSEGLVCACNDVVKLYAGEEVPLFKFKIGNSVGKRGLQYSDYLRILLLFENEGTKLDRLRDLVQVNLRNKGGQKNDFELQNYHLVCSAEAVVEINLWFLPLLNLERLGFEQFTDGSYRIEKATVTGYGTNTLLPAVVGMEG